MAQAFLIDDELRRKCEKLRAFAERPEHWWRSPGDTWVPGDRDEYRFRLPLGQRVVFTITDNNGLRYRHLSVSFRDRPPNEVTVYTIATMMGFTGGIVNDGVTLRPADSWVFDLQPPAVCVVQRLGDDELNHDSSSPSS